MLSSLLWHTVAHLLLKFMCKFRIIKGLKALPHGRDRDLARTSASSWRTPRACDLDAVKDTWIYCFAFVHAGIEKMEIGEASTSSGASSDASSSSSATTSYETEAKLEICMACVDRQSSSPSPLNLSFGRSYFMKRKAAFLENQTACYLLTANLGLPPSTGTGISLAGVFFLDGIFFLEGVFLLAGVFFGFFVCLTTVSFSCSSSSISSSEDTKTKWICTWKDTSNF